MCLLNIFLTYNFEELWACQAMSDQTRLISFFHTKNLFYTSTHFRDKGILGTLQSDWLRASWAIIQGLEFFQSWNLGW